MKRLLFIVAQIGIIYCIYVPGDNLKVKPLNSKGIKTIGWQNETTTPKNIQIHQSYSNVKIQQHEDDTNLQKIYNDNRAGKYLKPPTTNYSTAPANNLEPIPSASDNHAKILPCEGGCSKQILRNFYSGKTQNHQMFEDTPVAYTECPKGATGQFPHELSCNRFLNCYKGRGMTQNCPPGTLFNPKTSECDYSDKVDCISGPKREYFRNARFVENVKCPREFSGIIPHYVDCSKFINCANGKDITMSCPPGTLFDIKTNTCNHPQWSTCINNGFREKSARIQEQEGNRVNDFRGSHGVGQVIINAKCPGGFTGLMEHPRDCSKFLNCANGRTFVQNCGPGTLFNPVSKVCDFPHNVKCRDNRELETSETSYYKPIYDQTYYKPNIQATNVSTPATTTIKNVNYVGQPGYYKTAKPVNGHHYPSVNDFDDNSKLNSGRKGVESTTSYYPTLPNYPPLPNYPLLQKYPPPPLNYPYYNQQLPPKNNPLIQFNPQEWLNENGIYLKYQTTTEKSSPTIRSNRAPPTQKNKQWPPPFPSTDVNADYVFEYEDISVSEATTKNPSDWCEDSRGFECGDKFCIAPNLVCDGFKDCPFGQDEIECSYSLSKFVKTPGTKLAVKETEKVDNVTLNWCAKLCDGNRKVICKAFNYRKHDGMCFLLQSNVGDSGTLIILPNYDYFEHKSHTINCTHGYLCKNKKCINTSQICDGLNDCGDARDEKGCNPKQFGYKIKLVGGDGKNSGRIEVEAFGTRGYICDDMFGIRNADVVCHELGFPLGALEVRGNSYFAQDIPENNTFYMMDDVSCLGNETTLMDCNFNGWGVHNCRDQEIVGVVCKTPLETCPKGHWQCKTGNECLNLAFVCDDVHDCTDSSDEHPDMCDSEIAIRLVNGTSKKEGRLEMRYHGIWGTVCDDDFNDDAAKVVCKQLGYEGAAVVRKDGHFGIGEGPIWLDQVSCKGNESSLQDCAHWDWGEHNCEHLEDVGVTCSDYDYSLAGKARNIKVLSQEITDDKEEDDSNNETNYTLPENCGLRSDAIFRDNSDVHFRVVQGSVAKPGDYPWQAGIRVKGKTKASHWCGAVIISQKFVLTAAHCLVGFSKGAYFVVAGDYNVDTQEGTEQEANIEDFIIHENFRSGNKMNNDIALIELKGKGFKFTNHVQAICLPEKEESYLPSMNCTVSGFGSIESGKSKASHDLRAGWIPVQSREVCKMPHVYGEAITEGMFCAGSLDEGVDACDGDSGGPLACLHQGVFTLFGLTSWGQHCGYANKPGVYTKVSHYRNWIEESMRKLSNN